MLQIATFSAEDAIQLYECRIALERVSVTVWLRSMLEQLFDKMLLLRIQTIQQNREVLEIRVEHRSIYEAVAQRNSDAAAEAAIAHLIAARTRVVRELQMFQPDQKNRE